MTATSIRAHATSNVWLIRALVAAFLILVVYSLLVVPAHRYFAQRSVVADRSAQLGDIRSANAEMTQRLKRLDDPDEIQRIARRDYGLVTEGEESYTILPAATAGLNLPSGWPFGLLSESVRRVAAGEN